MNFCLTSEFLGSYLETGHKKSGPVSNYKKNLQESFYLKKDPRLLEGDTGQRTIGNTTVILLVKSKSRGTGPESSWDLSWQKRLEIFWIRLSQIRIISILGLTQGHLCLQKIVLKFRKFHGFIRARKASACLTALHFWFLLYWGSYFEYFS